MTLCLFCVSCVLENVDRWDRIMDLEVKFMAVQSMPSGLAGLCIMLSIQGGKILGYQQCGPGQSHGAMCFWVFFFPSGWFTTFAKDSSHAESI